MKSFIIAFLLFAPPVYKVTLSKAVIEDHKWDRFYTNKNGVHDVETLQVRAISFVVTLKNDDPNKKIRWSEVEGTLEDEHGNTYDPVEVAPQFRKDCGETEKPKPSLYPGDSVVRVLSFEPPILNCQELTLKVAGGEIKIPCVNGRPVQRKVKPADVPRN